MLWLLKIVRSYPPYFSNHNRKVEISLEYCTIKRFYKYHGAGNDFILFDDRLESFPIDDSALISKLCDRHFGIGADGLMLLRNHTELDFKMVYFNSDGRPSSMCGNGGRCITRFAFDLGMDQSKFRFLAIDGLHEAEILSDGVRLQMCDVNEVKELPDEALLIDTGSPHYLKIVDDLNDDRFIEKAQAIRYSELFKELGVNVNFIQPTANGISIRTYERGVENETLACGTGVTAAAIAMNYWGLAGNHLNVKALGGDLSVSFDKTESGYQNVWKTGPVEFVFKGEVQL